MATKGKEQFKTMHDVFDEFTNRTIYKLISQGHFEGLESPIEIGKESNVFTAKKGDKYVIVKIYRLETCDFNKMYDYIHADPRYANLKGKKRKIIFSWVQREFRNLLKARELGVPVPTPYTFINNIIVMECIGKISQKVKDKKPKDPRQFLKLVVENMKKLYDGGLVHADLSPFNILNNDEKPVFIDFSQSSPLDSSRGKEFLDRDIRNIVNFFRKLKVTITVDEVRSKIVDDSAT